MLSRHSRTHTVLKLIPGQCVEINNVMVHKFAERCEYHCQVQWSFFLVALGLLACHYSKTFQKLILFQKKSHHGLLGSPLEYSLTRVWCADATNSNRFRMNSVLCINNYSFTIRFNVMNGAICIFNVENNMFCYRVCVGCPIDSRSFETNNGYKEKVVFLGVRSFKIKEYDFMGNYCAITCT